MSTVDDVAQAQLDHFAVQLKHAMAADLTIVIAEKPNHELKRQEVGVGIYAPAGKGHDSYERVTRLLLSLTDSLMVKASKGACRVVLRLPNGDHTEPEEITGNEVSARFIRRNG